MKDPERIVKKANVIFLKQKIKQQVLKFMATEKKAKIHITIIANSCTIHIISTKQRQIDTIIRFSDFKTADPELENNYG